MTSQEIITHRRARWLEFYRPRSPVRRLFMITVPDDPGAAPRPLLWPQLAEQRIRWGIEDYQRQLERLTWLDDDSLPFLDNITGTEIFAEAMGCAVHRPAGMGSGAFYDNMPFARSRISRPEEVAKLSVPDLERSSLQVLFDIADGMRRGVDGQPFMRLVDIQSPIDIAALVWEKSELLMATHDQPAAVLALTGKIGSLLTAFCDEWFRRYGREGIAHFPTYYAPQGFTLSEDEVGVVSPATFSEFFAPELAALAARYGGLGMHCCAQSRHQWENFRRIPGLTMLNIGHQALVAESLRVFADHVPMIPQRDWLALGEDPAGWFADVPPEAKLVVCVNARSRDHARRLAERLRPVCAPGPQGGPWNQTNRPLAVPTANPQPHEPLTLTHYHGLMAAA